MFPILCVLLPLAAGFNMEDCDLLDLTHPFNNETVYWPNAKSFNLDFYRGLSADGSWYEGGNYSAAEHGGTHMDAPSHLVRNANRLDKIPLTRMIGEACVVNVSESARQNPDYQISIQDIEHWERVNGQISPKCILLFLTGYGRFWPDRENYLGSASMNASLLHFPGVGIDTASLDYGQSQLYETHRLLGAEQIYGLENMANLDLLPSRGATVIVMPMLIEGGSGAPVRAFAYGWNGPNDPCKRKS